MRFSTFLSLCLFLALGAAGCLPGGIPPERMDLEGRVITEPADTTWARAGDDIWVGTELGAPTFRSRLVHYDGVSTSPVAEWDGTIAQVLGSGPDDVWVVERETVDAIALDFQLHWHRGSESGFEEQPLPVPDPEDFELLGGTRDEVWAATTAVDADDCVVDVRTWSYDGASWTEVAALHPGLEPWSVEVTRDGEGGFWVQGETCEGHDAVLSRWSAAEGWAEVTAVPAQPIRVDRAGHAYAFDRGQIRRHVEGRWLPGVSVFSEDSSALGIRASVTEYGVFWLTYPDTDTSCHSLTTCGRTTTDTSHGVLHFVRHADGEEIQLPVTETGGYPPIFLQESLDEAWMISPPRVWHLDLRS